MKRETIREFIMLLDNDIRDLVMKDVDGAGFVRVDDHISVVLEEGCDFSYENQMYPTDKPRIFGEDTSFTIACILMYCVVWADSCLIEYGDLYRKLMTYKYELNTNDLI